MSSVATITLPTVSLYYKSGGSDKEYHLTIMGNESDGFSVQYRYGKRGQKLRTGLKNRAPVDFATAKTIYDDNLNSQLKDGYTLGEDGTPYVGTENQGNVSGLYPQLLNIIEESKVEGLIESDEWLMQEKKDGVRQMIRKDKKLVEGINKKGLIVSLPETVVNAINTACGKLNATLDGELVGEVYWLFDLLSIGVHAFSDKSYKERLKGMQDWFSDSFSDNFLMAPTAIGKASKKALYNQLKKDNAEGVVFKKLSSIYKAGRPNSGGDHLKFKFITTATVRVKCLNDKNSFQMEMLSKGDWIDVGNCTFFPTKNSPKPKQFVEVSYLYVKGLGGNLYGPPVLLGVRTDVDENDCLISQLKYQQGSLDGDDES